MTERKFYIAFGILASLVVITLSAFAIIIAMPIFQKIAGINEEERILEQPQYNPLNPTLGPNDAKLKIIEFGDFLCPYCKQNYPIIRKIAEEYPEDVQIIWKNFPVLELHPTSGIVAVAAQCANSQGNFWEYHDLIFENQKILVGDNVGPILLNFANDLNLDKESFAKCLSTPAVYDQIGRDYEEGRALGIKGTPHFFLNDVIEIDGVVGYEELEKYIK